MRRKITKKIIKKRYAPVVSRAIKPACINLHLLHRNIQMIEYRQEQRQAEIVRERKRAERQKKEAAKSRVKEITLDEIHWAVEMMEKMG